MTGCSFAPEYERPVMSIPKNYVEAGTWVSAKPELACATQTNVWWALYHDQTLNDLEQKVTVGNENLKLAWGRYQEARAIAEATRSAMYPTIMGVGSSSKQQTSGTVANSRDLPILIYNSFLLSAVLNYEVDAWGRVRNAVAASESQARASQFDLAAINLSMHAELAADYFELRGDEAAQRVLDATVVAYKKALYLTQKRHEGGASAEADVDQAVTQLENAKTLATEMRLKRAKIKHAIAVLVGEIPANFTVPPARAPLKLVTIAPALPSTLLERRPDIAAAEQRVKAANASIGVARAAFFPYLNLVSMVGFQSAQLSQLISTPSLIWSLGPGIGLSLVQPEITQVIFDGFKLQALLSKAKASYFESVSIYRQTVLTAFQQVEDALVAIRRLDQENKTQGLSTRAAKRALYQANRLYHGGLVTYLEVVITENQALQAELALIDIRTRRQLASVQLIKALGGGWAVPQ